jgi:hypothetical protein
MYMLEQGPSSVIRYHFSVATVCQAAICARASKRWEKGDCRCEQGLRRARLPTTARFFPTKCQLSSSQQQWLADHLRNLWANVLRKHLLSVSLVQIQMTYHAGTKSSSVILFDVFPFFQTKSKHQTRSCTRRLSV